MRRLVAVLAAATLAVAAGCARTPAPSPRHADPVAVAASAALLVQIPAEEPGRSTGPDRLDRSSSHPAWSRSAVGGESGPSAAAANEIVRRFADEQLTVLDLQTDPEPATPPQATVNVTVVYGTGHSHPDHARYQVDLTQLDDHWAVIAIETAP